jgi:acyl dehydratase
MADPRSGTGSLGLDALRVGAEIPTFVRTTGPANWSRYAAVNDEFVGIHMDDEAGRAAGAPGAFGMGNLQWAYLHNMLRDWLAQRGRIVTASCQFRELNTKGQTVTARGRVTGIRVRDLETLVDLDVWTEDQERRTLAKGAATVALQGGLDGESGQHRRAGRPPTQPAPSGGADCRGQGS